MKIYRPDGKLWREVVALDSSFCEETLERFNRISLDFVLAEEVLVPELCYVTWRGERYSLFSTPKVVKVSTREYRYTLNLEGRHLELDRVLVKDKLGRTKFVFTGRTDQYAELISDCLPSWKVGACTTGDATRVIAFNNTSLLEACRMVASKFETEVQLTDGAISFGRVERYKSEPLLLAYRNGLKKDITVEPDPKETAIGRLYVVGGDRNIDPAKYGEPQLHLLKGGKVSVGSRSFTADAEGRYISLEGDTRLNTSERAFDASSIYPKRVGTVSKVEQVGEEWDVLDDTNTIDYGQHRVGGDTMRLEFQSGRLAGRTFDLATKEDKLVGYIHSEKRFKLVRKEIDGVLMPEPTTFYPAVGDKYAIFGCSLPDEYITSAEGEMLLRGAEYMAERLEPRLQYRAELDGLWAKKNWATVAHKLVVGTIVRLEGASSEVRISSVRTSLNSPYTPRITFSNAPYMVGSLATQIATLENAEVRQREELRAGLVKLQDRTYKDTEAVREMVEKLKIEGFSKALKPETLQTMYAVIGSPALQFEFVGGGFSWTEGKGGAITIPQQTIRQRVTGTTLEPEPKTVETTIPALTYTLKPDEQQAHIYVELKPTPRYVVSTKPLEITPDRLLVGLLNGTEGSRDFTPLYGFTEISPSHIATRYIRSRSGNMLIDLETGNIYSDKIEFRRPDGSTKDIDQVISEGVQVGGRNLAVMSRMVPGYLRGDLNAGNPGDVDYKVVQYYPFNYDPTYYPIEEGANLVWVIKRTVNPERNAVAIIHWHNENKELISWDYGNWRHPAGTPRVLTAPKGTRYYRFGIPEYPKRIQVKLERGTVATDWTPAPEDVQADIDKEAKAREAGDKAQADSTQTLQQALDALRESGANDNATLTDLINKANQRLDNLQEQADGEVSNWFYPGAPAPDKAPENEWTTNGLKARHIGDTYTSTDESGQFMGKSWRYTTEFKWQEIHDTLVSQALAQASKAQTTADGKSTTFLVKPTKYEEGDTWVMESSQVLNGISYEAGTMLFAKQGSSAFVESHWVDKVRYIGATQLKESEKASKRAWEAYANAQAEAERVKAEAHADGIVTAEEQARINATNKALETAKAYAEAQDKLLEERQKAYADGVLTEAERRAVDVAEKKAKLAETNAKAYSDGVLTEAEKKAIAQAQKAYDDAVKRAEELDGQIQVGGRNLLLKSNEGISNSDYSVGRYYIADPSMMIAGEAYTIQIWGEAEGADFSEALWVYNSGGNTEVSNIQKRVNGVWRQTFKWRDDQGKSNSSLVIFRGANHSNYKKGSKTSITRIKLEKGTIATDWTPAPEDVQAEIDAINANPPRINQTTKNWEVYVPSQGKYVDTGRTSVGDDGKAPKIVDGYWYEWDSNKGQYTNTDIKARGIDGKDAVRVRENLMRYRHIANTWFWYPKVTQGRLSKNVSGGVVAITGGDKCTEDYNSESGRYVFVVLDGSGSKDFTDPEAMFVYSAKIKLVAGEAKLIDFGNGTSIEKSFTPSDPKMTEGNPLSVYCIKKTKQKGIAVGFSLYLKTDSVVEIYDIKVERVEEGEDPKPTAYLPHPDDLKGKDGQNGRPGKDVDPTLLKEIQTGLSSATTAVETLQKAQQALDNGLLDKADTKNINYLLRALKDGSTQIAGGLLLSNNIILSDPNSKDVTAMISGTQTEGAKAMRLGIDYGGDKIAPLYEFIGASKTYEIRDLPTREEQIKRINELGYTIYRIQKVHEDAPTYWLVYRTEEKKDIGEATAFNNNGTGHIGELFFNGNYIGFGDALNSYMQVGGTARAESDMVNASTEMLEVDLNFRNQGGRTNDNAIRRTLVSRVTMDAGNREVKFFVTVYAEAEAGVREIELPNGSWKYLGASASVSAHIEIEHKRNGTILNTMKSSDLYIKAETTTSFNPQQSQMPFDRKSDSKIMELTATQASVQKEDVFEIYLVAGYSTNSTNGSMLAEVQRVRSIYPKDTSKPEVRITQDKTSFFYGRSRYMLLNYDNLIAKIVGDVLMQGNLTVKGTITADSYQGNGMPLAGATFNSNGTEVKALGRYKNKRNYSSASAYYDYSTKSFTVYHSIPHDRYIPLVNAFNDPASPVVSDVSAYSFKVRFTLQSERYNGWAVGFSYIAFQAE